ncbi:hypothetical protein J0X14_12255 [Muricauda sp. CAU 1633]|uniref:hypothetical protein n=1 Tax=Allomuricauda sp. CAU 1633 TaxID=2816036 RepID=UPI001A8EB34A|nr:hypothetical protein [Muricauda sp. CAU 1633]MBO0323071.1 hypothetical protein [Muricauda sp. CAU 1633]
MITSVKKLLPLTLLYCLLSYGQDMAQEQYNVFDDSIGIENTGLYQGKVYLEKYRTINERVHFYKGVDFFPGSVLYDGQWYYDLDIKYDVYDDEVLLRLVTEAGGGTMQLLKEYLESFVLDGEHFVKILEEDAPLLSEHGFYAISMEGTFFTLYTKYTKRSFDKKDRRFLYYEFLDGPSEYALYYKDLYHPFNSKNEVIQLFPELKKEIKDFYALARRQSKADPDGFKISLAKRIELLISRTRNTEQE